MKQSDALALALGRLPGVISHCRPETATDDWGLTIDLLPSVAASAADSALSVLFEYHLAGGRAAAGTAPDWLAQSGLAPGQDFPLMHVSRNPPAPASLWGSDGLLIRRYEISSNEGAEGLGLFASELIKGAGRVYDVLADAGLAGRSRFEVRFDDMAFAGSFPGGKLPECIGYLSDCGLVTLSLVQDFAPEDGTLCAWDGLGKDGEPRRGLGIAGRLPRNCWPVASVEVIDTRFSEGPILRLGATGYPLTVAECEQITWKVGQ